MFQPLVDDGNLIFGFIQLPLQSSDQIIGLLERRWIDTGFVVPAEFGLAM